jgi:hypothetical protein
MDMKYKLILFFFALLVPISLQDQHRLNYGVVFQSHTSDVDFAADVWTHTFEIPLYIKVTIDEMTKMFFEKSQILFNFTSIIRWYYIMWYGRN